MLSHDFQLLALDHLLPLSRSSLSSSSFLLFSSITSSLPSIKWNKIFLFNLKSCGKNAETVSMENCYIRKSTTIEKKHMTAKNGFAPTSHHLHPPHPIRGLEKSYPAMKTTKFFTPLRFLLVIISLGQSRVILAGLFYSKKQVTYRTVSSKTRR